MEACFCDYLHRECDRNACERAGDFTIRRRTIAQLRASKCITCDIIVRGLMLPEIKPIWKNQGWVDAPDESKLQLEWANGTSILRTWACDNGYFWRHFAFSLDSNTAESQGTERHDFRHEPDHIIPYTGSPDAFTKIREWLDECNAMHHCAPLDAPDLPDRVVKIDGDTIKVESGKGRRAFYATLSHCWGGESPVSLDTTTFHKLTTGGVPLSTLPRTFQDFLTVAREFDLTHVWIDSLCIIQDDQTDWARQSTRMHTVYGNSYLNIAAKNAPNCHGGCFTHTPDPPPYRSHRIPSTAISIRPVPRETHHDHAVHHRDTQRDPEPLLQRGWVLQERLLAPRTLFFGRHELLWECNDTHRCQCGAMSVFAGFKDYWTSALRSGDRAHFAREHHIAAWMKVVSKYSVMRLSHERDRLIALEGVASQVRAIRAGAEYVAGMWREHLERQVTWYLMDGFEESAEGVAPSWSWASKLGSVGFRDAGNWDMTPWGEDEARIIRVSAWDQGTKTGGELEVSSKAVEVWADVVGAARSDLPATFALRNIEGNKMLGHVTEDILDLNDSLGCRRRLLLLWWGWAACGTFNFLVLKKHRRTGSEGIFYERFGVLANSEDDHWRQTSWILSEATKSYVIV